MSAEPTRTMSEESARNMSQVPARNMSAGPARSMSEGSARNMSEVPERNMSEMLTRNISEESVRNMSEVSARNISEMPARNMSEESARNMSGVPGRNMSEMPVRNMSQVGDHYVDRDTMDRVIPGSEDDSSSAEYYSAREQLESSLLRSGIVDQPLLYTSVSNSGHSSITDLPSAFNELGLVANPSMSCSPLSSVSHYQFSENGRAISQRQSNTTYYMSDSSSVIHRSSPLHVMELPDSTAGELEGREEDTEPLAAAVSVAHTAENVTYRVWDSNNQTLLKECYGFRRLLSPMHLERFASNQHRQRQTEPLYNTDESHFNQREFRQGNQYNQGGSSQGYVGEHQFNQGELIQGHDNQVFQSREHNTRYTPALRATMNTSVSERIQEHGNELYESPEQHYIQHMPNATVHTSVSGRILGRSNELCQPRERDTQYTSAPQASMNASVSGRPPSSVRRQRRHNERQQPHVQHQVSRLGMPGERQENRPPLPDSAHAFRPLCTQLRHNSPYRQATPRDTPPLLHPSPTTPGVAAGTTHVNSLENQRVLVQEDSSTVEIWGLSRHTMADTVHYYFENSVRSGGGEIQRLYWNKTLGLCLLTFEDADVAQNVASRQHILDGKRVTAKLHDPQSLFQAEDLSSQAVCVNNFDPMTTTEDALRNYFENPRNAGGEVIAVDIGTSRDNVPLAIVTFGRAEDAQNAVSTTPHRLNGRTLTVSFHTSYPALPNVVSLSGLPSDVLAEDVRHFAEAVTQKRVYDVIMGQVQGVALVVFEDRVDFAEAQSALNSRSFQRLQLTVEPVPLTRTVEVHNLPRVASLSEEMLTNYFLNTIRSGGSGVTHVQLVPPANETALVTFEDPEVCLIVASLSHTFHNTTLDIRPHFECVGLCGPQGSNPAPPQCPLLPSTPQPQQPPLPNPVVEPSPPRPPGGRPAGQNQIQQCLLS